MVNWPIDLSPTLCIVSHDVHNICRTWLSVMPNQPRAWDDGIDQDVLLEALLCVGTKVHFRCGFCHDMLNPHTAHNLCPADLAANGTATKPIVLD